MIKKISLLGRELCYDLQRKRVKNINLRIKPDCSLHVSASRYVSESTINEFLRANAEKIISTLDKFSSIPEGKQRTKMFADGDILYHFGKEKVLRLQNGSKNDITSDEFCIYMTVKDITDADLKRKTYNAWLKEESKTAISLLCERAYPIFKNAVSTFPEIKYRLMKTRWGSCMPKTKVLTFNTALAEYSVECIEYVVFHEFTHFIHPNHSKAFYAELEKHIPDWKERKARLKTL